VDHRHDEGGAHRPSSARRLFRVRIEDLLLPPNLPAGMDVLTLFSLAALLHKTTEDPEPVSVRREDSHWRITDGRHRAIAALIAGRTDVLAEETAPEDR
jgi:hypothetical protein